MVIRYGKVLFFLANPHEFGSFCQRGLYPSGIRREFYVVNQFPAHVAQAVITDELPYFIEFYFRFKIFGINHIGLKIECAKLKIILSRS